MRVSCLLLMGLCSWFVSVSQHSTPLYYMSHLPQTVYANPANLPTARFNLALPGLSSNNFTLQRNNFDLRGVYDAETGLDPDAFVNGLEDENFIRLGVHIDAFHLGFTAGRNYFNLSVTESLQGDVFFPREAAFLISDVFYNGNFTQNVNIAGMAVNQTYIRTMGLGWTRAINEKLTIGAKAKMLSGLAAIQTNASSLLLDTEFSQDDPTVGGFISYDVVTSGWDELTDSETQADHWIQGNGNMAFAFDLGAKYTFLEKFEFSGSLLNLGGTINWKNDVNRYSQDGLGYEYNLLSGDTLFGDFGTVNIFEEVRDLVDSIIGSGAEPIEGDAFKTTTPTTLNLSAGIKLTPKLQIAAFSQTIISDNGTDQRLKLVMQSRVKRMLNTVFSYSLVDKNTRPLNLGVGLAMNIGFFQWYVMTENALLPLYWEEEVSGNVRFGVNLTIGRDNL